MEINGTNLMLRHIISLRINKVSQLIKEKHCSVVFCSLGGRLEFEGTGISQKGDIEEEGWMWKDQHMEFQNRF